MRVVEQAMRATVVHIATRILVTGYHSSPKHRPSNNLHETAAHEELG
jgi:hypothetical protein